MGFNLLINFFLKTTIQQPRPDTDDYRQLSHLEKILQNGAVRNKKYGMPSRHSQSIFFSTIFIWLSLKNIWITAFYLAVDSITVYHRYLEKYHTIEQLLVGSFLGVLFGYSTFIISQKNLMGTIKPRKDDNAPRFN